MGLVEVAEESPESVVSSRGGGGGGRGKDGWGSNPHSQRVVLVGSVSSSTRWGARAPKSKGRSAPRVCPLRPTLKFKQKLRTLNYGPDHADSPKAEGRPKEAMPSMRSPTGRPARICGARRRAGC